MITEEQLDEAGRHVARRLAVVVYIADFEAYAHLKRKWRRLAMSHCREALHRFDYSYDEIDHLDDALEARHGQMP